MKKFVVYLLFPWLFSGASVAATTLPWLSSAQQNGQFVQEKHLTVLTQPFVTKGSYAYQSSSGLDWRTEYPVANELNISIDGVAEIQADGSRKSLTTDTRFSELLLAIFSGDQGQISQQFSIVQNENRVTLTPKAQQLRDVISEISLLLEANSITQIVLYEPAGNSTKIFLQASIIPAVEG